MPSRSGSTVPVELLTLPSRFGSKVSVELLTLSTSTLMALSVRQTLQYT